MFSLLGAAFQGGKEERGSLLFSVLLFTAVLIIVGSFFLRNALDERLIAKKHELKIRASYIAEAGAEVGLAVIRCQPDYFLQKESLSIFTHGPIFIASQEEEGEQFFVLEWIPPNPNPPFDFEGHPEYYTLYSTGCYHYRHGKGMAGTKAYFEINENEEGLEINFKNWSGW